MLSVGLEIGEDVGIIEGENVGEREGLLTGA